MAILSRPRPAADHSGAHAAVIVLAVFVFAALVLWASGVMDTVVPSQISHATNTDPDTALGAFSRQAAPPAVTNTPAQNAQPTGLDRTPLPSRPQPNPAPQ